ncbi:MAG: Hsp33 family molecular chaperone HslO [Bacilli bacterium]|jgi:molecular chaperone Hsp33|nr:Hsp33 family molecular chaperone HslO [Bacilli bacterium]
MAIRGLALNNEIRVYGINSTAIIRKAQKKHQSTPCASAALGRVLSIVALMGMMSNEQKQIISTINGNGPLGAIHAHYQANHTIRGYVDNPQVAIKINEHHKLGIKEVVGSEGTLSVMINYDLKQDYYGMTNLISGEISEDYAYYFASSEQIPSVVSAGVLVDKDGSIISSGALILQLLPNASEKTINYLENCLPKINNLSKTLQNDPQISHLIKSIFDDFIPLDEVAIKFNCPCTKDDMYAKIMTLSIEDLLEIKEEDHGMEVICPWCSTKYHFNEKDLTQLIKTKVNHQKNDQQ